MEHHQPSVCRGSRKRGRRGRIRAVSPGPSCHLHASVEGRLALKVVHDDAVVAVDDVLVDALPPEVLQNLVDAIDAIQDCLHGEQEERGVGGGG